MDEPEPMPAFTFNPDGPTTITHPDGTVSVNPPRPDGPSATAPAATDASVPPAQAGETSSTTFLPESPDPLPESPQPGSPDPQPPDPQPGSPDPLPEKTLTTPEPSGGATAPGTGTTGLTAAVPVDGTGMAEPLAWEATPDARAGNSVVNPDGSITTRLPDGSTQTVARLPGGATIVTSTTQPGAEPQPAPPDSPRARRWRGRSR
jgi:hypothetical protein